MHPPVVRAYDLRIGVLLVIRQKEQLRIKGVAIAEPVFDPQFTIDRLRLVMVGSRQGRAIEHGQVIDIRLRMSPRRKMGQS